MHWMLCLQAINGSINQKHIVFYASPRLEMHYYSYPLIPQTNFQNVQVPLSTFLISLASNLSVSQQALPISNIPSAFPPVQYLPILPLSIALFTKLSLSTIVSHKLFNKLSLLTSPLPSLPCPSVSPRNSSLSLILLVRYYFDYMAETWLAEPYIFMKFFGLDVFFCHEYMR